MYYCDTSWHGGQTTDADVMITVEEPDPAVMNPAHAACEEHAGRALRAMFARFPGKVLRVRAVSNAARRAT
jgi:hypothetical protein